MGYYSHYPKRRRTRQKYGNLKTTVKGIEFDSEREARRYLDLYLMQVAGEIKNLRMQVTYELIPTQREPDYTGPRGGIHKGRVIEKSCTYIADFVYEDKNGNTVVEDTKGFRTKDYIIKKKLMLYVHGIRIREV